MVFTSQGIHQAPTMVYPGCHGVLPITTIELLVALLHNSCCLLCASINSRLGVTCSCKSLAQCAPLCWVGGCWRWHVSAPLLLGREEAPGLRISAPGHITPACLSSTCITMKHVLPCCSSNRIRATSYIANALVLLEIFQHNHQTGEGGGEPANLCTSWYFCLENVDSLVIVYKRGLPYITPFLYFLEK